MSRCSHDINFNAGYNGCNDKVAILKNSVVQRNLENFEIMTNDDVDVNSYIYVDHEVDGKTIPSKIKLAEVIASNAMQSDWNQTDNTKLDYIWNKPKLTLTEDLVSLYNVGGIHRGEILPAGKDVLDILIEMLSISGEAVFRFGVINADKHGALPGSFSVDDLQEFDTKKLADLISNGWSPNKLDCPELKFDELGNLVLTGEDDYRVDDSTFFDQDGPLPDGTIVPTDDILPNPNENPRPWNTHGTFQGQFFIFALPKNSPLDLEGCYQHGYALGLAKVEFENTWNVYINADDLYLRQKGVSFDDGIPDGNGIVEIDDKNIIYQLAPSVGAYKFNYKFKLKD